LICINQERFGDYYVIFQLCSSVSQGRQKTYLFQCLELDELASLIECYSPSHATWLNNSDATRRPSWRITQVWFTSALSLSMILSTCLLT